MKMKNKTIWLVASCSIVAALLLASCAPAVEEAEEVAVVVEEEEVTQVVKEEEAKEAEELEFEGTIEAIDGTIWTMTIEGETRTVDVSEVEIDGEPVVGLQVKIEGTVIDDIIVAGEVEIGDGEEERDEEPQPQEPQPQELQPIPEEVQVPVHKYQELALFALELINRDRVANGLDPVVLGSNIASQNHAEENLTNVYSSHWGMDGLKPYMRYTLAGGVNYVGENVLGTGTMGSGGGAPSYIRDPKEMLEQAQEKLMDSPGHRATILNKWHKKVSLGIAYDDENLDLVQNFEGDYIEFSELPSISSTILSMIGNVTIGNIKYIALYYDSLPQPLSPEQLNAPPYDSSYSFGEIIGNILPPLPPSSYYTNLSPIDVIAMTWDTKTDGSFTIEADISQILGEGNGVYTVIVWVETGGESVAISNYSIFVQ